MFSRVALRVAPSVRSFTTSTIRRGASDPATLKAERSEGVQRLKRGAKKDPELFPLYVVTAGVFAWAGWRFVQSPTGSDHSAVKMVPGSEPWRDGAHASSDGKYKYHPYNDAQRKPVDAPSALNVTIIPNVNLPKELHDQFNKWGKEEFDVYTGSGDNYQQDSSKQARNVLTGDIPPGK